MGHRTIDARRRRSPGIGRASRKSSRHGVPATCDFDLAGVLVVIDAQVIGAKRNCKETETPAAIDRGGSQRTDLSEEKEGRGFGSKRTRCARFMDAAQPH